MLLSKYDLVDELEERKLVVVETLAYIQREQAEVERNMQWKDLSTQKRRCLLLADLCSWYEGELKR